MVMGLAGRENGGKAKNCRSLRRFLARILALILVFRLTPGHWHFFWLGWQIPGVGDETRGQMPRPLSTLQHFLLITRSSSAILSILMCDFLFQLTSSFVMVLFLLRFHAVTTPVYGFSIVIKLLKF